MFNYIDFDSHKINNNIQNLNDLPSNIKDKIVLNKDFIGHSNTTNINKYFNNNELSKLEDIIKSGCINDKSIYELGEKIVINNFNCIKLKKGMEFYRYFNGFITIDKIEKLLYNRNTIIYNLFSKYTIYNYLRTCYGSILCYKLSDDIILLDLFNYDNIKIIIDLLEKYSSLLKISEYLYNKTSEFDFLIHILGFNKTLNEQIIYFNKVFNNSNIFVYDKVTATNYNNIYKNIYYENNLNIYDYTRDINPSIMNKLINNILTYILNIFTDIDGIIVKQVFSQLSPNGVFDHEEIIVKPECQLAKLKYFYKSELNWTNWTTTNFDIKKYTNILIQYNYYNRYNGSTSNNTNYKLLVNYRKYPISYTKLKQNIISFCDTNKKYILIYDTNNFLYTNYLYNYDQIINKIIKLIKKLNKYTNNNLDYIYFFNYNCIYTKFFDILKFRLHLNNYKYIFYNNNNLFISKNNPNIKMERLTITNDKITNTSLFIKPYYDINKYISSNNFENNDLFILTYDNKTILFYNFIHLLNHYNIPFDDKANEFITKFNINIITKQINILIDYNCDIIITNLHNTDFNYYEIFNKKNYNLIESNNKLESYYSIYSKINIDQSYYIEYSNLFEHLPLLQSI